MKDDVEQYLATGFDAHLGKLIEHDKLFALLTQLLTKTETA
jgi:CheY-like chemotaxis protein